MLGHRHRYAGYRAYVEAGIDEDIKRYYNKGNIAAILGDKMFRESVQDEKSNIDKNTLHRALRHRPSSHVIIEVVADVCKVNKKQITRSGQRKREQTDPRKIAMYCCQQIGDIPLKEIADHFELNHVGSVSRMIFDIKEKLKRGAFKAQLEMIEKRLLVIQ